MHLERGKNFGSSSNFSSNPRTSSRIVVLKPGPRSMENSENVTCQYCSSLHHSLGYKCKRDKPRFFSFGDVKKKLKFAAEDNRKEQHRISTEGNLDQLPYEIGGKIATKRAVKSFSDAKTRDKIGRLRDSKSSIKPEISVSYSKRGDFDLYLEAKRHLSERLSCVDQDGTLSDKEAPRTLGRVLSLPRHRASKSGTKPEISALNQSVCEKFSLSTVSYSKRKDFDIYLEAKRHLSERLSNVDQHETLSGKEAPRTLGRVLSLPQHEFLPTLSPNRDIENSFVTAQMRFSLFNNLQKATDRLQKEDKTSCLSSVRQNIEASPSDDQLQNSNSKPDILVNLLPYTKGRESICSIRDDCSSVGFVKSVETNDITSARQSTDTANICEEVEYLECSRPDSPSENQQLSINKLEVGDSIEDRTEHPSPMSVLEPFSIEDVISPPSTTIKPAKSPMQPLHIDFEEDAPEVSSPDPKIHFGSCNAEALLQGGCLNWDKLFLTWDSSDQLHCQSLFDELELPPTDSSCDPKLLFDCFNEVVSEVYQCYFGCSPCLSFLRPKIIRPVPAEKMVVHEIKKRVHQYLLPPMMPRTLEQLVGEDLASSRTTWMDIRLDTEDIVIDMVIHSPEGMETLRHFLFDVCEVTVGWTMEDVLDEQIKVIKGMVGTEDHVICALSGGVDSTVAATLVHKAIGDRLHCVFVENGLLRKSGTTLLPDLERYKERERVMETFKQDLHLPVTCVDATKQIS